jgi:hypothetical protein
MSKVWLALASILTVAVALVGFGAVVHGQKTDTGVSEIVDRYIDLAQSRNYAEAYSLTGKEFRDIIPMDAFVSYHKMLDSGIDRVYQRGRVRQVTDSLSEVQILNDNGAPDGVLMVAREGDAWSILADWQAFYPVKVKLLPPVAEFKIDGVTATLRYFLAYPATEHSAANTVMRLDVVNSGDREVRWELPIPGTNEGYVEDPVSGKRYFPSYGYSIGASELQGFSYIPKEGGLGTILLAPGAIATIRVHFEETIPQSVPDLTVALSGLSFTDTNDKWTLLMHNVTFKPEVVPAQ